MPVRKISRPTGRPSNNQRLVEAALIGIADDFASWLTENRRVASGDSKNFNIKLTKRGANQNTSLPNIQGELLGVDYLEYALFGRGQGRNPPWQKILRWMRQRGIRGRTLRGNFRNDTEAAKAIAVAIGRAGTRALRMSPVVQDTIIGRNTREAVREFTPLMAQDSARELAEGFVMDVSDLKNIKATIL